MIRLRPKAVELLADLAVVALGLRVLHLFVRYIVGSAGAQRFQVETWALIFIAVGLMVRVARSRRAERRQTQSLPVSSWTWLVFCGLAVALYWPALSVGFLSDDFVLLTYASDWRIGPVTPALFRPIPLFTWAVLLHAGGGAALLHLLNIVLHGTNAWLTARVVQGWAEDRMWSLLAGLLVLTAPLAPEAVVWLSGVFDLMATALVLTCILVARRYDGPSTPLGAGPSTRLGAGHPSAATRVQFVALGIAAVASKETAVVAAGLVLVDASARNALSRKLCVDTGIMVAIVGAFGLVRLVSAFGVARPPLTKYILQRALFGSFGGLAVPWHIEVLQRLPVFPILGVLAVVFLLTLFFLNPAGTMERTRLAMAAALWVLVSIVPVFPILYIAPDLQQSRYLYLPAVGWAALIVAAGSEQRGRSYRSPLSVSAVVGLIGMASYGTVLHLRPWNEAALLRERVEASAVENTAMNMCPTISLSNVPDSVKGAYVFRNGVSEAFARDLHLNATGGDPVGGPCAFRWSDAQLSFVQ
jgi:hypothetical protein